MKLLSLACSRNEALIWLPFSCNLVVGKMAKVELENSFISQALEPLLPKSLSEKC
jgi:hypothetical protein